jgi:hypothetical protein
MSDEAIADAALPEEAAAPNAKAAVADVPTPKPSEPTPPTSRWARWRENRARKLQAKAERRNARKPLDPDELTRRLFLQSSGIVEEIHALALRQIQAEEQRESRLDTKAQALLLTSGLSLTAASTFGGLLLQHPEYTKELKWLLVPTIVVFGSALVLGLLASICAVHALLIRDVYQAVDEHVVLDAAVLKSIDIVPKDHAAPRDEVTRKDDLARAAFRRYVANHYWQIWQQHFGVHDLKADIIKRGQLIFVCFLGAVMLVGGAMTYAVARSVCH